jgi:hypothetical protein
MRVKAGSMSQETMVRGLRRDDRTGMNYKLLGFSGLKTKSYNGRYRLNLMFCAINDLPNSVLVFAELVNMDKRLISACWHCLTCNGGICNQRQAGRSGPDLKLRLG